MSLPLDPMSVLIIGNGPSAAVCSQALINNGQGRFRLAGVVQPGQLGSYFPSSHSSCRARPPQRVVVALDDRRGNVPLDELIGLRFQGVTVQDAPTFLEHMTRRVPVRSIRPGDLLFAEGFRFSPWKLALKDIGERLCAVLLLLLTAPVLAAAILAILIETGRPVFFRQKRVGLNGSLFKVTKLRTMRQDAEQFGAQFCGQNDPRITRVGRFLRRTRIDELPQLINVLLGEMALVGPRPERPEFVGRFEELSPYFVLRHSVRPGLTGWAQIRLGYIDDGEGTLEKLSCDLFYIKHFSPLFDLKILLWTVKTVLGAQGR